MLRCGRLTWGWALAIAAAVAGGTAQAGVLAPPDDLPPAGRATAADADAEGGRVLGRALRVDAGAGERRLDLLLELQRGAPASPVAADAVTTAAGRGRPASASSAGVAPPPAMPAALGLLRDALQGDDADTTFDARTPDRADPADARREPSAAAGGNGPGRVGAEVQGLFAALREATDFVRDHLLWLVGGAVLVLVLAGVAKLVDRRV